jgi:CRISPR type IV-associated protein Csf2
VKHYRWNGSATAMSSIAHGGQTLGTTTYLRREKFLLSDGTVEEIPVISGNGLRGVLRDAAAEMLWEHLGRPKLPFPVVHALWSGGALIKAKGQPLTGERLATLRRLVPHIGVFGVAGGGRIIDGALQVGKMLPVCAETAHLLPDELRDGPLPKMWDLVQIEEYTRLPNADRLPEVLRAGEAAPGADESVDLLGSQAALETGNDGLMRYGHETFIAGTRFHLWFGMHNATAAEHSFFTDALNRFTAHAFVGGRVARGHGQLRLDLTGTCLDGEPEVGDWRDLGGGSAAQALEALTWLD